MSTPPLYDVPQALGVLRRYRDSKDPVARASVHLADGLAANMARHFPDPSDAAIAGHALVIVAASLGAMSNDVPPSVAYNLAALAGQRLAEGVVP